MDIVFPDRATGFQQIVGGATSSPLLTGLVSQYKMNASSGAAEPDTIGSNNLSNNGTVGTAAGVVSTCRTFSSTNWLSLATGTPFNLYPMTIALWLKTTGNNANFLWHYNASLNGYKMSLNAGGVVQAFCYTDGSASNRFDGGFTTVVNDGNWKHLALVIDASGGKLYINGVSDGTISWVGTPQAPSYTGYFSVGINNLDGSALICSVDIVKIASRAWTASDVLLDYNGGAGVEL